MAHQAMAEGPGAPSTAPTTSSTSTGAALIAELEAAAAAAAAPPPPPPGAPTKLCLELGWELWKGKSEEEDEPSVEFALTMYDTKVRRRRCVHGDMRVTLGVACAKDWKGAARREWSGVAGPVQ